MLLDQKIESRYIEMALFEFTPFKDPLWILPIALF